MGPIGILVMFYHIFLFLMSVCAPFFRRVALKIASKISGHVKEVPTALLPASAQTISVPANMVSQATQTDGAKRRRGKKRSKTPEVMQSGVQKTRIISFVGNHHYRLSEH